MDELTKNDKEFIDALLPTESPEAPQSGNVTGYFNGFSIQITCRNPQIDLKPMVLKMKETAEYMSSLNFLPSWNETTNEALKIKTAVVAPIATPPANPGIDLGISGTQGQGGTCPVHGAKLVWKTGVSKTRNSSYAFWACPTLNADGSFCRAGSQKK